MLYPTFKITKPIRLIELFAGYGSQALALKYLGVNFEHWKICEWAVKSIQAYKDIHFTDDNFDYSWCYENKEDIVDYLYEQGISSNYNEPMTKKQISRLNEKQLRTVYNNIRATHNLVNIQTICGEDLEIVDTDKYDYILTYSFPCQDLSLAGKGKGMRDTSTRSGMLWEVERILIECEEKPQILIMENVPMVHSSDNVEDFNKWQLRLEELGYKNYWQDLIATDYGIPQTRNRTFMVSILGDYNYTFPKPISLKLKLKDILEDNVDEKYYLSNKMMEYISSKDDKYKVNENKLVINRDIACSKTTREGNTRADTTAYICNELPENTNILKIKNATKKGYLEASEGDGVDISSRMEYHRGTVQKGMTQTLSTMGGENVGVIVKKIGNYSPSNHNASSIVDKDYAAPTVMENHGTITAIIDKHNKTKQITNIKNVNNEDKTFSTLGTNCGSSTSAGGGVVLKNDLRIRKLTPRECFRLMGVKDEDFDKVAKNQSDSSLYHLAGDSIVVNVLMEIFGEMI